MAEAGLLDLIRANLRGRSLEPSEGLESRLARLEALALAAGTPQVQQVSRALGTGSVSSSMIADGAITAPKVAAGALPVVVVFSGGTNDSTLAAGTFYGRGPGVLPVAAEADAMEWQAPAAGVIRDLRCRFKQGATGTTTFTARKNAADQALTTGAVAGTGAVAAANDLVNTFTVAAGDVITLKAVLAVVGGSVKGAQFYFYPT